MDINFHSNNTIKINGSPYWGCGIPGFMPGGCFMPRFFSNPCPPWFGNFCHHSSIETGIGIGLGVTAGAVVCKLLDRII